MRLKSVCFVKIYISGCCVDTYLNSSRTDSKEKRCRAEADPSPRPSRGEGAGRCAREPSEVFPLGVFWECVGPVSVALSWSGLQGACIYPSPRPSRGEGGWSLRSLEPSEVFPLGAFWVCGGPVSVALSWSGLQGAFVYPSPRPSRGEGGWSLRSDVAIGGCCFRAFCCRASVVCGVVLPAGGRTGSMPVRVSVPGFPSPHALFL